MERYMIFITGDIHGSDTIIKLNSKNWPKGNNLTKNDFLIILGDFGLVWSNPASNEEKYWLKWLSEKSWTTLIVDGNHDNHDMLSELETVEKFGNIVGKITDSIYHLKRGCIYKIEGKKIFAFGGAETTDKISKILRSNGSFKIIKRIEGKDWWARELPNKEDKLKALESLNKANNDIDIIVAHTLPKSVIMLYEQVYRLSTGRANDPTSAFLEEVCNMVDFNKYYCGHFHDDMEINKYRLLYNDIIEI
jgi:predicted phosphodiesterase